ncbi:membrane-bound lytic murein transglycosylase MltF [Kineobactrum salinum]|uniref:Membrane-bound lytic murein transglycosylase F n=1 Tax=Kineobactrum salinum TaxID=2708301 RepID=A0A6C0U492_9GAMM|nr:membrane-bound lytic murein transglycosylase MltF [Kineobactrum salinum]QIB66931.1 membrane-bound lytic murein transglycosylase MltF [Kineobactrum salinum]
MRILSIIPAPVIACLLCACAQPDSLQHILDQRELVVVSRSSPTTYYLDKNGAAGFEYDLVQLFAEELGVELKVEPAFSLKGIFRRLQRGEAHIAAAGLSLTPERSAYFAHSQPYASMTPRVIYKTGHRRPDSLDDAGDLQLVVLADSSHEQALLRLRETGRPELRWQVVAEADSMELLEMVDSGAADLAIIDSNEFRMQQSLYPRLDVAFDLGEEEQMVWYLPPGPEHEALRARADTFLAALQADGRLRLLREQHFGHTSVLSRIGSHTFARNIRSTLPAYRDLIRQVADEYQLDWHLLAATAYQESHWDPRATSPTGVRGLMMLTTPTAEEMGVTDRLDPLQSLRGGARYLKNIRRRLPADIYEPDRTWMALAAYNIGRAHLEDARVLTERHGGDPHLWKDVMQYLPLLQKREHYRTLRYGYARGQEAVSYVQNIRHYYSILQWQDIPATQPQRPLDTRQYLPQSLHNTELMAL